VPFFSSITLVNLLSYFSSLLAIVINNSLLSLGYLLTILHKGLSFDWGRARTTRGETREGTEASATSKSTKVSKVLVKVLESSSKATEVSKTTTKAAESHSTKWISLLLLLSLVLLSTIIHFLFVATSKSKVHEVIVIIEEGSKWIFSSKEISKDRLCITECKEIALMESFERTTSWSTCTSYKIINWVKYLRLRPCFPYLSYRLLFSALDKTSYASPIFLNFSCASSSFPIFLSY